MCDGTLMLSTKVVGHAKPATEYYLGKDNYYTKDSEQAKENSLWWGKGTHALGIAGHTVDADRFQALLHGQLPDGQQLGVTVDNTIKHRAGFDLTFSVPKTLSILALTSKDDTVRTTINTIILEAATKTLAQIEHGCAQARITQAGNTTYVNTGNLTVALFLHDISREGDPNLHVHAVVMNMTQRHDGQWRSLASKSGYYGANAQGHINGFIERVRHDKRYYGTIFRSELAFNAKQHHIPIVVTDQRNAYFEVDGISAKTKDVYSTRAQQIKQYMQAHGFSSAKAAAVAAIKTRQRKRHINRDTLHALWQTKATAAGIDVFKEADTVTNTIRTHTTPTQRSGSTQDAKESVQYAIDSVFESYAKAKCIQLINVAMQYAMGKNVDLTSVITAIEHYQTAGVLIPIEEQHGEFSLTTKTHLDNEKHVLRAITLTLAPQRQVDPANIKAYLAKNTALNQAGREAIHTMLTSTSQVVALDGTTHTGKTRLITPMVDVVKQAGFDAVILTPTKAMSMALRTQINGTPKTWFESLKQLCDPNQYTSVSGFIHQQKIYIAEGREHRYQRVIMVDNAHVLGTQAMKDLVGIARTLQTKLILIGDQRSALGWQHGSPYQQLLAHGITAYRLTTPAFNSHKAHHLAGAIHATLADDLHAAFTNIGQRILSVANDEDRMAQVVEHYSALSQDERRHAIIMVPTQAQAQRFNEAVHQRLKTKGIIAKTGVSVLTHHARFMRHAQYCRADQYRVGDWVQFHDHYVSLNVTKGDYVKIVGIHPRTNTVVLERDNGKQHHWNPEHVAGRSGNVAVFTPKRREVAVGDRIVWKKNNYRHDIHSGEVLDVIAIHDQRMVLQRHNQKNITVNVTEHAARHFDHAYATTIHHQQSVDTIIAVHKASAWQSTKRQFYKTLSQARQHVWLYTDDRQALLSQLKQRRGDKTTIMDTLLKDTTPTFSPNSNAKEHVVLLEAAVAKALHALQQRTPNPDRTPDTLAADAVRYALAHLSEREAAFKHKDVFEVALTYALGDARQDHIQQAILAAEHNGELVRGVLSQDGTRWTTQAGIDLEKAIIALAKEGQRSVTPLLLKAQVETYLADNPMKADHRAALTAWMTSTDRVLMLQGRAGTGKTTLLAQVEPLLKTLSQHTVELLCLAPTHKAVKELRDRGLHAQTLDSFLGEQRRDEANGIDPTGQHHHPFIMAVDENSMTSNRRLHDVLWYAKALNARVIMVGDVKQHHAIEAGKPDALLKQIGIHTLELTDIVRQRNNTLRQAVKQTYEAHFNAAFNTLGDRIIEVGEVLVDGKPLDDQTTRLAMMAKDYAQRSPRARAQTAMITLGNAQRKLLNDLVVKQLRAQGELSGECHETTVFVPKDMTTVEQSHAANFVEGDILRFGYTDQRLQLHKGEYWHVKKVHPKENILTLCKPDHPDRIWQPTHYDNEQHRRIEVYTREDRTIMPGMMIRWTRTDKTLGLISPEFARIHRIDNNIAVVDHVIIGRQGLQTTGKTDTIDLTQSTFKHWDLAYSLTSYAVQGGSYQRVLANMESYSQHLTTQKAFLIMLTRAVKHVTFYTNNKQALLDKVIASPGDKTSALETIGEVSFQTNTQKTLMNNTSTNSTSRLPTHEVKEKITIDANHLITRLHDSAEYVVLRLLGEPKKRNGTHYQYSYSEQFGGEDTKRDGGSFFVAVQGDKQGLWYSFKTGEGGNLLQLIQKKYHADFKQSLDYAMQLLGVTKEQISTTLNVPMTYKKVPAIDKSDPNNWNKHQKDSVAYATKIAERSQPIKGTLAEKYLREHRGIHLDPIIDNVRDAIRFHPAVYSSRNKYTGPALIAIARNQSGNVQSIQAIYLDEHTAQKKADLELAKQTWGVLHGASVKLNQQAPQQSVGVFIEGPEDGVSVLAASQHYPIEITLSQSNYINAIKHTDIEQKIVCLDNDGGHDKVEKTKLVTKLKEYHGIQVAIPDDRAGYRKTDYNDMYKADGPKAVVEIIERAQPVEMLPGHEETAANPPTKTIKENVQNHVMNVADKYAEQIDLMVSTDEKLAKAMDNVIEQDNTKISDELIQAYQEYEVLDSHVIANNEKAKDSKQAKDIEQEI